MQLTRGASEASGLRRTHHRLVPLAAERRCSACLEVRPHLNGRAIAVGARTGKMEPKKYFAGKGPGSESARSTLRMPAYRYEAEKQRPSASVGKRSLFLRLISIGTAAPSGSSRLPSGWPGPFPADHCAATNQCLTSSVVRLSSEATGNVVSMAVETDGYEHVAQISWTPNNGMQLTRRGGAVASRPVVEARLAADPECCTGTCGRNSMTLRPFAPPRQARP
jgi:hypothetical protein